MPPVIQAHLSDPVAIPYMSRPIPAIPNTEARIMKNKLSI